MNEQPGLEPTILVIFGITGDLSKRYLLPALYHLFKDGLLAEHTRIVGLTRQSLTADELFGQVELCINEIDNICDPAGLQKIRTATELMQFDPEEAEDYPKLHERLNAIESEQGMCMNRLYYLSIPPELFDSTVHNIGAAGLNGSCQHGQAATRLLVEKPFGSDLASAEKLIAKTNEVFSEEQVFRIDHYLAKETVQDIVAFRRSNPIFADVWNNQHISAIDIVAYESLGVGHRINFYERVGALRDVVQSHLLQLMAVTMMELPQELDTQHIHAARQKLLRDTIPADPSLAVRGQYEGYRTESGNPDSTTETFARVRLSVDDARWQGTAVTISTGKALSEKLTQVSVTFHSPEDSESNRLTFRIYPNEGIHLELKVKQPGFDDKLEQAVMDFSYANGANRETHPDAYERVLLDAVRGDRTLFATSDEVLSSWRIVDPIISAWRDNATGLYIYPSNADAATVATND
jgi:glucose-6-phosphate 1-dehydrogenase